MQPVRLLFTPAVSSSLKRLIFGVSQLSKKEVRGASEIRTCSDITGFTGGDKRESVNSVERVFNKNSFIVKKLLPSVVLGVSKLFTTR